MITVFVMNSNMCFTSWFNNSGMTGRIPAIPVVT